MPPTMRPRLGQVTNPQLIRNVNPPHEDAPSRHGTFTISQGKGIG